MCRATGPATSRPGGRPGRTRVAAVLDDQADHLGGGDDALCGGRIRAHRSGQLVHPVFRRRPGVRRRFGPAPGHRPGHRAGANLAPATHTGRSYLGFHRDIRWTPCPGRRFEWSAPPARSWRGRGHLGRACRGGIPALARSGTISRWRPTLLGRPRSRSCTWQRLDEPFAARILCPLGRTALAPTPGSRNRPGWPPSVGQPGPSRHRESRGAIPRRPGRHLGPGHARRRPAYVSTAAVYHGTIRVLNRRQPGRRRGTRARALHGQAV